MCHCQITSDSFQQPNTSEQMCYVVGGVRRTDQYNTIRRIIINSHVADLAHYEKRHKDKTKSMSLSIMNSAVSEYRDDHL